MQEAIMWDKEKKLDNDIFETDCQNVVNSLQNTNTFVHWMNQGLVQKIRHSATTLNFFDVRYVKRTVNNVAHVIADNVRTDRSSFKF